MKTPLTHDGRTHATGKRRLDVTWDDPGPRHADVPNHVIEEAVRAAIQRAGGTDVELAFYDERATWERRPR